MLGVDTYSHGISLFTILAQITSLFGYCVLGVESSHGSVPSTHWATSAFRSCIDHDLMGNIFPMHIHYMASSVNYLEDIG